MPGAASRLRLASSRGSARASSRACACAGLRPVDMLAGPELEADQRPDALGVIAASLFVLLQYPRDFARPGPAALLRPRVGENLTRPSDQAFVKPAAQRHAETALGPRQHRGRH